MHGPATVQNLESIKKAKQQELVRNLQEVSAKDAVNQPLIGSQAWWERAHGNPLFRRTAITPGGMVETPLANQIKTEHPHEGEDAAALEVAAMRWKLFLARSGGAQGGELLAAGDGNEDGGLSSTHLEILKNARSKDRSVDDLMEDAGPAKSFALNFTANATEAATDEGHEPQAPSWRK